MSALARRSPQDDLVADIGAFYADPLGFVRYAFAWGSGDLADELGPDEWQTDVLTTIGDAVVRRGDLAEAIRLAVASGHGIGKTALVAWIILWFMATRPGCAGVVTANTADQLEKKTWRELAKWRRLCICGDWFLWTATKFAAKPEPESWFISAITWTKERSEAFAGTHESEVLIIYDEASGIPRIIWEVTEGALTTPAIWLAFGNPTQNTGRFAECFGSLSHRWITRQIDSRTARKASKTQIAQWIEDYGEDSDFVRVRVRGVFPRASAEQYIAHDIVAEARRRTAIGYEKSPKVLAVDVARFGDDQTVLAERQGQRFTILSVHRGMDTMQTAARVADAMDVGAYDAVFIDGVGVGGGVVDRLRQMNRKVVDVNAGAAATDDKQFFNKRAEMWSAARDWLKAGGCLPEKDEELATDLTSPEYFFDGKQRLCIERKDDMKARGLRSPDKGDALTLTFAGKPVAKQQDKPRPKPRGGWMGA